MQKGSFEGSAMALRDVPLKRPTQTMVKRWVLKGGPRSNTGTSAYPSLRVLTSEHGFSVGIARWTVKFRGPQGLRSLVVSIFFSIIPI